MSVRSAQSITVDFTVTGSTGALVNADSLPTGTLVVNGTDNGATVTVTNKATGIYKAAATLPTLAVGDVVQLRIAATVSGVASGAVVWTDSKDLAINANGEVEATDGDGAALATAAGALTITPILCATTNPRFTTRNLADVPQYSAPTDIVTVTDANGTAIDLSAKDLRLVACETTDAGEADDAFDDTLTGLYKYELGSGLAVGGDDNNQVTISHDAANTETPGQYPYMLWNVTDRVLLMRGILPVVPAVFEVSE